MIDRCCIIFDVSIAQSDCIDGIVGITQLRFLDDISLSSCDTGNFV